MALSGQNTIAAAGTAEPIGTQKVGGPLQVKALIGNLGLIFIGNNGAGDVDSTNGLQLSPGEPVVFEYVGNLSDIYIDAANSNDGVSWLILVS